MFKKGGTCHLRDTFWAVIYVSPKIEMGIVGQRIKKNRQSWIDKNLNIMLKTIWHIIS